jgi:hypothetical protein
MHELGHDCTGRSVSRSAATITAYRKRYHLLVKCAARELGRQLASFDDVVLWFLAQSERWSRSTVSQYRGSLSQAVRDLAAEGLLKAPRVQSLDDLLQSGPTPRTGGKPRTSARKVKSVPRAEFGRLLDHLLHGKHPDDPVAARFLSHNTLVFLRPCEFATAKVVGETLYVRNAKVTNGRSFGSERARDLAPLGEKGIADLKYLFAEMSARADACGGFKKYWSRLASRIARACAALKIKRVSLYTTRHIGIATAKAWMSAEEVAASAGHRTTRTATSHYASRRTGWGTKMRAGRPRVADVEKVIRSEKASRAENLAYLARKRTLASLPALPLVSETTQDAEISQPSPTGYLRN